MIHKYYVVKRTLFLFISFVFFNFCNSNTNSNGLFGLLFSNSSNEGSISIRDRLHSGQSVLPANAPQPIYQYEYTDMYGSQVFYYSMNPTTPTGWSNKQTAFYAFNNQRTGTIPVYQYYAVDAGGRYRFMYSTNLYCAVGTSCGWYNSGPAFYAFPNYRSYTRSVFAYIVDSPQQRFFYTENVIVPVGGSWTGWTNGGTAFYVPQFPNRPKTSAYEIEGYSSTTSVAPGDTIKFYLNNPTTFGISSLPYLVFGKVIPSSPGPDTEIETIQASVDTQNVDSCTKADGCSWSVTLTKTIPSNWGPGLYYLKLTDPTFNPNSPITSPGDPNYKTQRIYFVVKPIAPASLSNILMIIPFSTWQAYNTWKGTSTYPDPSQNIAFSPEASFNRPTIGDPGRHVSFILSMLRKGYTLEFASDVELHTNPNLLDPYQLVMFVGQNEYISKPMRQNLDFYVQNGGNMAVFGGNTSWFQIRLESDSLGNPNRRLICYKTTTSLTTTDDPKYKSTDLAEKALTTFNWFQPTLNYPENQTFGLSYRNGTIFGNNTKSPGAATDFEVKQADHWVFSGMNLQDFQRFGIFYRNGQIVDSLTVGGGEGDSLYFRCGEDINNDGCPNNDHNVYSTENKKLYPTGKDGAPMNFQILAYMDARLGGNGHLEYNRSDAQEDGFQEHTGSVVGLFENNGTVFNGGIYDWHRGLEYESGINDIGLNVGPNVVSQIVWNVINKLSQPKTLLQKATIAIYQYSDFALSVQSLYYSRLPFLPKNLLRNGQVVYKYDGQAFYAFDRALSGTVPIYQYQVQDSNGLYRFMYSPNEYCPVGTGCLGWNNVGVAFYAYLSQQPGTIPVYAYSADSPQRFLYSPALYCEAGTSCLGWYNNGPAFYVPSTK
ncbi:N,N-dimethylformamidase beta subunit family domain-containing protein [Leptospira yasudae]|uniref:Uncharacterized protein n=1 Tax=Leptospira yasudae TaxID=2202201 RepID=A0A6N4QZV4_9LEPT|nr:N,N-dimethylformamidase beta subunit family domain-containing protein [Leptospira yasudae]TGL76879.1 hypothetical protein EHQ77_17935 [Leptospira yasudae]TGL79669.1 hypothetical protein EHQ72_08765 [Leptospira yasudae]TGL83613.1 hypothetical protein EHQ83_12585 [Leptospira yasudae]